MTMSSTQTVPTKWIFTHCTNHGLTPLVFLNIYMTFRTWFSMFHNPLYITFFRFLKILPNTDLSTVSWIMTLNLTRPAKIEPTTTSYIAACGMDTFLHNIVTILLTTLFNSLTIVYKIFAVPLLILSFIIYSIVSTIFIF